MRILFTKSNYNDITLQKCPHNITDINGHIVNVGGDACKACKYCTHYEIHHCLVPKDISLDVDDWYTRCFEYGMNQFNYIPVGFVECKHGVFNRGSVRLMLHKIWYKIKSLF